MKIHTQLPHTKVPETMPLVDSCTAWKPIPLFLWQYTTRKQY